MLLDISVVLQVTLLKLSTYQSQLGREFWPINKTLFSREFDHIGRFIVLVVLLDLLLTCTCGIFGLLTRTTCKDEYFIIHFIILNLSILGVPFCHSDN
jgi:hypothetical protein